jgi:hypothetical protein
LKDDTSGVSATNSSPPIACSLAASAARDRTGEWRDLLDRALIRRSSAPGGVRIELRALPGVRRELERLIAAERECCPFMTMSLDATDQAAFVVVLTAPQLGVAILDRLFGAPVPPAGDSG